jgi:hypothetical protein
VKKARYAFAAAGVAPALGLLAPAATAAPAITHAQVGPAKTVRLSHATTARHPGATPLDRCHSAFPLGGVSAPHHEFRFSIKNYGHCVRSQFASLNRAQAGISERIRAYSQYGAMTFWRRVGGTIESDGTTAYPREIYSSPGRQLAPEFSGLGWNPVYQICAALVIDNTNKVLYGPVCLYP